MQCRPRGGDIPKAHMKLRHWCDLIRRAVKADGARLTDLAAHMRDCESAKDILFAKGYGKPGMTVAAIAALVPAVHEG